MTAETFMEVHVDHPHDSDLHTPFQVLTICLELAETLDLAYDVLEDCGVFYLRSTQRPVLNELLAGLVRERLGYSYCGF